MPLTDVIEGVEFPREPPITCPLCSGDNAPVRIAARFGMTASVADCRDCRLAYQTPRPSDDASRAYMNWRWSSDSRYVTDSPGKRRSARKKLRHVQSVHPKPGTLLDFGAGSGAFVHACLEAGWDAEGVERSEAAVARAQQYYSVTLLDSIPDRTYDVITLWDVVEHLRDPISILKELRSRLSDHGSLIMETGNWENWRRLIEGEDWGLYLLDHHYYFTPHSLETIAKRAGFSSLTLLDVNRKRPSLRRTLTDPSWGHRAWRTWREARTRWPGHGDMNVMMPIAAA